VSMDVVVLLLAMTAKTADSPHDWPTRIFAPGSYHGWEVKAADGDECLALFAEGGACFLREAVIHTEPVFDPYFDSEGEASGLTVSVVGAGGEPLFLMIPARESSGFSTGEVPTIVVDSPVLLPLARDPLGVYGSLRVEAKGVFLEVDGREQRLSSVYDPDDGAGVRIVWAGDLDRDGRIDFLLDDRPHYAIRLQYRLFLSGEATHGCLLQEVARFISVSC
jgi:hypothetical protein